VVTGLVRTPVRSLLTSGRAVPVTASHRVMRERARR